MAKLFNHFIDYLDGEPLAANSRIPHQVAGHYARVEPTPVQAPRLIAVSETLARELALDTAWLRSPDALNLLSGCAIAESAKPYAMNYGGHQFGHWAGQLGDGRAINLGETYDKTGKLQTLQLKGAGMTPFSRHADGLAVLRSSLREFLCSEAMHYLGVPTTRALSLCLSGEMVWRDMFYDGNPEQEPGAVVCRVATSFLRFGNFQLFAARKDKERLCKLLQYVFDYHCNFDSSLSFSEKVIQWFTTVCDLNCRLAVDWTRVGFVHGVLNTDNMSILGLTIDYGPYGWLEAFDPTWTPNTTDAQGRRYCFGQQPQIVHWNLYQLANALALVVDDHDALVVPLHQFSEQFSSQSTQMYANKLGLEKEQLAQHAEFLDELFKLLHRFQFDWTLFFVFLQQWREAEFADLNSENPKLDLSRISYRENVNFLSDDAESISLQRWLGQYRKFCENTQHAAPTLLRRMKRNNPRYILRNYLVQQAIEQAQQGDFDEIYRLQKMIERPYELRQEFEHYAVKAPAWAKNKAGCSMLSCSS